MKNKQEQGRVSALPRKVHVPWRNSAPRVPVARCERVLASPEKLFVFGSVASSPPVNTNTGPSLPIDPQLCRCLLKSLRLEIDTGKLGSEYQVQPNQPIGLIEVILPYFPDYEPHSETCSFSVKAVRFSANSSWLEPGLSLHSAQAKTG